VEPLTEKQIRSSFVNCTKGEAARLRLPLDFAEVPWPDLDFLGWVDPGAPLRAHLVMPSAHGRQGPLGRVFKVVSVAPLPFGAGRADRSPRLSARRWTAACRTAAGCANQAAEM
jgi:hypothetical protein